MLALFVELRAKLIQEFGEENMKLYFYDVE